MAFRKSDQGRLSVSADLQWPVGVTPPPEFQTAVDFARDDEGHLFVTGRAGTGKSTLLRAMREMITQEAVVLAPTGLAAVNVGGQTIHSFFGFPPRLIRPDDIRRSRNGRLMRKLKAIIIDEVSMVRSDLMWAIDQSLRMNRGRPREAFGGVRLHPVRRFASVAAGRAGRRGGRAPRKRVRRAVLLPGARLDGRRRSVADRARARVPSEGRDASCAS